MRKQLAVLTVVGILSGFIPYQYMKGEVYAESSNQQDGTANNGANAVQAGNGMVTLQETITLTLESALKMAEEKNLDYQLLNLEYKKAATDNSLISAQSRDLDADFVTSLPLAQKKYLEKEQAAAKSKILEEQVKAMKLKLKLSIEQIYFDALKAEQAYQLAQKSVSRAEETVRVTKAAYENGTKAQQELLAVEAGKAQADAQLSTAQNTRDTAYMQLKQALQIDLQKKIELKEDFNLPTDISAINLENDVTLALEKRPEIVEKKLNQDLYKLNYDLIKSYLAPGTYQAIKAYYEMEKSNVELLKTQQDIQVEVRSAYGNVLAAQKTQDALAKALKAQEESYRMVKLLYQNGMATTLEVVKAEEELRQTENKSLEATYMYNLALAQYEVKVNRQ